MRQYQNTEKITKSPLVNYKLKLGYYMVMVSILIFINNVEVYLNLLETCLCNMKALETHLLIIRAMAVYTLKSVDL